MKIGEKYTKVGYAIMAVRKITPNHNDCEIYFCNAPDIDSTIEYAKQQSEKESLFYLASVDQCTVIKEV